MVINKDKNKSDCKSYIAQVRKIIKVKAGALELKVHNCLLDHEAALWLCSTCHFDGQGHPYRIQLCCNFLSVFSCEALLWNVCVLFALRPYLSVRSEAEKSNKGKRQGAVVKVITDLWVDRLWSLVCAEEAWFHLDISWSKVHFLNRLLLLQTEAILYNWSYFASFGHHSCWHNDAVLSKSVVGICEHWDWMGQQHSDNHRGLKSIIYSRFYLQIEPPQDDKINLKNNI